MWCKDADRQDELIPVALAARAYIEASSDQTVAAYRELEKAVRIMWGANR